MNRNNRMKKSRLTLLLLLAVIVAFGVACDVGERTPATPTATLGPSGCNYDRDAINAVLGPYYAEHGEWPTADGQPGDMDWDKLVPEYLPYIPKTDSKCQWGVREVEGDPPGKACIQNRC